MWLFTTAIWGNRPSKVVNHGNMRRDFSFIDDIGSCVVACLDNPSPEDGAVKVGGSFSPHRVYNIGNNRPEELMHMIDVLEEAVGKKAVRDFQPLQAGDVPETYANIDSLSSDSGFAPTTSIETGIPRFLAITTRRVLGTGVVLRVGQRCASTI